jgi:hypothetical protein
LDRAGLTRPAEWNWRVLAACQSADPDLFFSVSLSEKSGSRQPRRRRSAPEIAAVPPSGETPGAIRQFRRADPRIQQRLAAARRRVPVLIEPGFGELQAGDLDGAPMEAYWSWRRQHTLSDRLPHGESPDDAFLRYANALRSLLARTEAVTLVVLHESALRQIALAARADGSLLPAGAAGNAIPFLFDEHAAGRAATSLAAMATSIQPGQDSRRTAGAGEVAGQTTARSASR